MYLKTLDINDNSKKLFLILLFLCIIFCLGLGSIGVCNATQQKGLEALEPSNPNSIKFDRFSHGTIGIDSIEWIPYRGLTSYVGLYKNRTGLGILASYEVGAKDKGNYIFHNRILNISLSFSRGFGTSSIYLSGGYSVIRRNVDIIESFPLIYHNPIASITYVSRREQFWLFMGQVRIQGKGIMISVGIGF